MARRKRELLDLLREQARQKDSSRSAEGNRSEKPEAPKRPAKKPVDPKPRGSTPPPKPATQKPATQEAVKQGAAKPAKPAKTPGSWARKSGDAPSRRAGRGANTPGFAQRFARYRMPAMASLGLLLVVALIKFWPAGTPAEASGKGGSEVQQAEPFSVLVATYEFSSKGQEIARKTGQALRDLFPNLPDPQLTGYPAENPVTIELWLGEAAEAEDLEDLLRQVQETSVPTDKNNPRPFATAVVKRRRPISS